MYRFSLDVASRGCSLLLSRCGAWASHCGGFSCWGAQAQQLWCVGSVALWHVGSSQTRDQTDVPCIGQWTLNPWTTRETLCHILVSKVFDFCCGIWVLLAVVCRVFFCVCVCVCVCVCINMYIWLHGVLTVAHRIFVALCRIFHCGARTLVVVHGLSTCSPWA